MSMRCSIGFLQEAVFEWWFYSQNNLEILIDLNSTEIIRDSDMIFVNNY